MILTLTGASGAGKTTIARNIISKMSNARILSSYTTRKPRRTDLPNEYDYRSDEEFEKLDKSGVFLWSVSVHGFRYGTSKFSVRMALADSNTVYLMILVPETIRTLRSYAQSIAEGNQVMSYYIFSPSADILRQRLRLRGDEETSIEKRIGECAKWDIEASRSSTPYLFVRNDGEVQEAGNEIISNLRFGDCF